MLANLDLLAAVILLLIAGIVFVLLKIHAMPVKGVFYVVGGLAALAGFELFRARRAAALNDRIRNQRKELDARREVLKKLADEKRISQQQYDEARSRLEEYEAAFVKSSALLQAQDDARRRAIESMSVTEVNRQLGLEVIPPAPAPAGGAAGGRP